jgi:GT2 family glycosyltransferase
VVNPTIAVVVPTFRRPESLRRCLEAIAAQTVKPERVVVVVRDDDEETWSALPRLQATTLEFESASVGSLGAVAAIEAGLQGCSEDVVALTDDDAAPHADWLERLRANYGPGIGGAGGRDLIDRPSQVSRRQDPVVGRLSWFGRLQGNHHLGVGAPREVDVLKGVNMSLRRELWRLDHELRGAGAQVHWEVGVCLRARRHGWTLVYDPGAQVDHFPGPRYDADDRAEPTFEARLDGEWNYAYVLARHVAAWRLPAVYGFLLGVGTRGAPGLASGLASCLRRPMHSAQIIRLSANLSLARASALAAAVGARPRVWRAR